MKCSSVFRTTVVKVIVDNPPSTQRTWLLLLGGTKPAGPGGADGGREGLARAARGGAVVWDILCGRQARARTASTTASCGTASPAPTLRPGQRRQRRPDAARRGAAAAATQSGLGQRRFDDSVATSCIFFTRISLAITSPQPVGGPSLWAARRQRPHTANARRGSDGHTPSLSLTLTLAHTPTPAGRTY
ncbi:hypothetical protein E2C01_020338 [Portunus trituberculatus]|uniref:Uncharacterized protein n=1 Tax=Portunus trituberculatus TaxID=210409 RepID=A0A5B7DZH4_PORTR|nr:hypothetical protein [Portunus trituberculatus]